MLYDISLTINYEFDSAAAGGRQILHLMPADLAGEQRLIAGHLAVFPKPSERVDGIDFFGNSVVHISHAAAHADVRFHVQARVDRIFPKQQLHASPRLPRLREEAATQKSVRSDSPVHYTGPSDRIELDADMTMYARSKLIPGMTVCDAVQAIGQALHKDMRFDTTATTAETRPRDAFLARRGVCQDISHIMIACLRGVGIPAGYVSGFLQTIPPEGQPRQMGADAMHAWVQAWCGNEIGWVEFDPTNAKFVDTDHIVVARGRDYADVAPIKGVLRTAGLQTSEQRVDVISV